MMYQTIGKRKNIYQIYAEKLVQEGLITQEEVQNNWKN
jgi:2-oxoglutarate dehydrogenase complex dehydrogenase (E1) component-like enzyme